MKTLKNLFVVCIAVVLLISPAITRASTHGMWRLSASLVAPHIYTDAQRIAELGQRVADAKLSADNGWMLVSAALVLLMTGPGLALFYGGLVRKKNVLATMLQNFAMMAI